METLLGVVLIPVALWQHFCCAVVIYLHCENLEENDVRSDNYMCTGLFARFCAAELKNVFSVLAILSNTALIWK